MEEYYEPICVEVNGVEHQRLVRTSMTLLDFIREELKLKGTKRGCDNGECGACTSIKRLLNEYPDPTDSQISYALSGNICRCSGYVSVANAVKKAAAVLRGE